MRIFAFLPAFLLVVDSHIYSARSIEPLDDSVATRATIRARLNNVAAQTPYQRMFALHGAIMAEEDRLRSGLPEHQGRDLCAGIDQTCFDPARMDAFYKRAQGNMALMQRDSTGNLLLVQERLPIIRICWQSSPEDIESICAGGEVVGVYGSSAHPSRGMMVLRNREHQGCASFHSALKAVEDPEAFLEYAANPPVNVYDYSSHYEWENFLLKPRTR